MPFISSDRIRHDADNYHRAIMSNGTSVPSNWRLASKGSNFEITWTPDSSGGVSYGSNAMDVTTADNGGASTDVSRMDHRHKGVHLISAASSNSLFGDVNFIGQGSVGVTVSGQTVQVSGVDTGGGAGTSASSILQAIYGLGVDGNVTISSPTSLTRDMYYDTLTVNDVLTANGWRIFCKTGVTGTGTIRSNGGVGGNGGNGTGAAGGGAGAAGSATNANNLNRGPAGKIGRVGGFNGTGLTGNNAAVAHMFRQDGTAIDHPAGTSGGAGANAGGGGGNASSGDNTADAKPIVYPACVEWREMAVGTAINMDSGWGTPASGGSGGGSATGGGGGSGGSGAGGGPIVLVAKIWTGSFVVESKGGDGGTGGNGFASSGSNGGGAGGNGGSGGAVVAIYADRSGWSGSIDVAGGSAGTHGNGNGGGSNGSDGNAGPTGVKIEYQMG